MQANPLDDTTATAKGQRQCLTILIQSTSTITRPARVFLRMLILQFAIAACKMQSLQVDCHMITMHPGEYIKEVYVNANGLTASQIAADCGIDQASMSRLINQKRSVTPLLALKLEKGTGRSAESWLEMQHQHSLAMLREAKDIDEAVQAADRGEFASGDDVQAIKDKWK